MMHTTLERILDLAIRIQQIPAPTFAEGERAGFVRGLFAAEGLADVEIDHVGNVYGRWTTIGHQPSANNNPLVVSAHLDTVFPENTELRVFREDGRVSGPGIGDNATGLAGLFGLVWILRERGIPLAADLWLVADVCEEGLGDLRGMQAVVDRFGDGARAYLVLEGMALGHVYHRALGVRRYRISIKTAGGHSWADYGQPSAIHELTSLAAQITSLKLPVEPRTTLNVGKINGGTSVNTIAAGAMLELDLRSESPQILLDVARQVEVLARGMERAGVAVGVEIIGQRLAGEIPAGHPLVQAAQECLRKQGVQPNLTIGSTDANMLCKYHLRKPKRDKKLFQQNFAGVCRDAIFGKHTKLLLMVIYQ